MTAAEIALRPARFILPRVLRFALRDLRGGLSGFGIFIACIAIGVAAITGVGSVARGLADALARQSRVILGGDAAFSLIHRELTPDETAFFQSAGTISKIATLRAMARRTDGGSALVELKVVGPDYPTIGAAVLSPGIGLAEALATRGGVPGLAVDAALLARLDVKVGDSISIGDQPFAVRAVLVSEPDKLAGGIGLGPRVLISLDALPGTGLVQPGSLVRWTYRVSLKEPAGRAGAPASDADLARFMTAAARTFPDAGWEARARTNVSPQYSKNLERFTQFLTLVGLTALIVGGVGVANAVRLYVERKRASIATLKALGGPAAFVFNVMLTEVMLVAFVAILIGLAVGAAIPFVVADVFGALIPFPLEASVYPVELALGAVYGLLTALVFALAPLGRTHDVPVSALFRDEIDPGRRWPRPRYLAMLALAAAALLATAVLFAWSRTITLYYAAATIGAFILLRLVGSGIMALARLVPHPRRTEWRLAIANIGRPGALTPAVVLSLGLGLTLLVALTLIEGNIRTALHAAKPGETPSFFFLDIGAAQKAPFNAFLRAQAPDAVLAQVPMMRGRILRLGTRRAESVRAKENVAWVLDGDRGITYADAIPEGSKLTQGRWWAADYKGPPLVSLDQEIAEGLDLRIGDTITVNVLGRTLTATIANLRTVNWRTFGINFVMVFSPNTFAGAPHTDLATLTFPRGDSTERDGPLIRAIAKTFPTVTAISVKDALDAANDLVGQLALAIRAAASVALVASVLVLAGALAAGQRARVYDAVVLKVLGATRGRLLAAYLIEYGLLGTATAVFAILAGTAAAYAVVVSLMGMDFTFDWPTALAAAISALLVTIGLGLVGTWRILGQKPAGYLRNL